MYEYYPDNVVNPYYFDYHGEFYITSRFWTNDIYKIRNIPKSIIDSIKEVIKWLHEKGIAHWDLKWNILFEVDRSWTAIWFKFIDPVGISDKINLEHFEQAKENDIEFINWLDILTKIVK